MPHDIEQLTGIHAGVDVFTAIRNLASFNDGFREKLKADPGAVLKKCGVDLPDGVTVRVFDPDDEPDVALLVLNPSVSPDFSGETESTGET